MEMKCLNWKGFLEVQILIIQAEHGGFHIMCDKNKGLFLVSEHHHEQDLNTLAQLINKDG